MPRNERAVARADGRPHVGLSHLASVSGRGADFRCSASTVTFARIHKTTRTVGVGVGTTQRVEGEMTDHHVTALAFAIEPFRPQTSHPSHPWPSLVINPQGEGTRGARPHNTKGQLRLNGTQR